ncbi:hypothetical protein DSECCO2_200310 [anaerobic digester metagenome]
MAKKNCIIVYGNEERVPANLLVGLIGEKGEYTVALWDEKVYEDSLSKITSDTEIIFIGETKAAKNIIPNIKFEYENTGMKYGWLGNRAVVYVEKRLLSKEEFDYLKTEFKEEDNPFAIFNDATIKKEESINAASELLGVANQAITPPIGAAKVFGLAKSMALDVANSSGLILRSQEIRKIQYDCVVKEFFEDGLAKFLEA